MLKRFTFFFLLLYLIQARGKPQLKSLVASPKISVKMSFSGDLSQTYQFDGVLGEKILGVSDKTPGFCENKSLFKLSNHKKNKFLEAWIELDCIDKGQNKKIILQRILFNLKALPYKANLLSLSEQIKKTQINISEVILKTQ